jgi:hypothetical protein
MSPVGLGTKDHCAGESQKQFTGMDWLVIQWQDTPQYWGVTSSRQTPPLVKEKAPFRNKSLQGTKIWSWVPTGLDTKDDCAGDGQQQFAGVDWKPVSRVVYCYQLGDRLVGGRCRNLPPGGGVGCGKAPIVVSGCVATLSLFVR